MVDRSAPSWHLYADAASCRISSGNLLMAGALLLDRPILPSRADWYHDLLRNPDARVRAQWVARPTGRTPPAAPKGRPAGDPLGHWILQQVADGVAGSASFHVMATEAPDIHGALAWEKLFAGLLLQAFEARGVTGNLSVYPTRLGEHASALGEARLGSIGSALEWLPLMPGGLPRMRVETCPNAAHILVGQSIVDLLLWNLRRGLPEVDYQEALMARLAELAVSMGGNPCPVMHFTVLPRDIHPSTIPLHLHAWDLDLGRVDWQAMVKSDLSIMAPRLRRLGGDLPLVRRTRALAGALEALPRWTPEISDSNKGPDLSSLFDALDDMAHPAEGQAVEPWMAQRLRHARAYQAIRMGRCMDALAILRRSRPDQNNITSPDALDDGLGALGAEASILVDLRRFESARNLLGTQERMLQRHMPALSRVASRGRLLLVRGRLELMSGGAALADFRAAEEQFPFPWQWVEARVWQIVAIARGEGGDASVALPLLEALESDLGLNPAEMLALWPSLLWAVMEMCAFQADHLPESWRGAAMAAGDDVLDRLRSGDPSRTVLLACRALALVRDSWSDMQVVLERACMDGQSLADGLAGLRLAMRALAGWGSRGREEEAFRDAAVAAKTHAAAARGRLLTQGAEWAPLLEHCEAFLVLDPRSLPGCQAFLARGDL